MQTIYYRSIRSESLETLEEARRGSWIHIVNPNKKDLAYLSEQYGFNADLVNDGVDLYESPRLEREENVLYIYTRYCRPEGTETSTEPLLLIVTNELVVTVSRHELPFIEELMAEEELVTTQKVKLLLQILEQLNKGYRHYLNNVSKQIFSSRSRLQKKIVKNDDVLKFIDTEEDLNEFLTALQPYSIVLHGLVSGKYLAMHSADEDLIEDIQLSTSELIELTKSRLKTVQNMRNAISTIAANNLNMIFKRLTSIAIFMAIPTIVGGLYGMNVRLPFESHPLAFWMVFGIITMLISLAIWIFSRKKWL